jgi:hypothetical protein
MNLLKPIRGGSGRTKTDVVVIREILLIAHHLLLYGY